MGRGVGKLLNLLNSNIIALKLCAYNLRAITLLHGRWPRNWGIDNSQNNRRDLEINLKRCVNREGVMV